MDQVWIRQVVGDQLRKRQLAGEGPVSILELQQLAGIGPGDATFGADLLVEEGLAVREDAPGGATYRLKPEEEQPTAAAVPEPPAAFPSDLAAAPAAALADPGGMPALLQQLAPLLAAANGSQPAGEPRELKLTSAVARAIDTEAFGAMILAGVMEAVEARAEFRLVVVP